MNPASAPMTTSVILCEVSVLALDVAAFINLQLRPFDPREGRLAKLAERIWLKITSFFGEEQP